MLLSETLQPLLHRLPTEAEIEQYGKNSKAQGAILEEAVPAVLAAVPDEALRQLLAQDQRREKDIEEGKLTWAELEREYPLIRRKDTNYIAKLLRWPDGSPA